MRSWNENDSRALNQLSVDVSRLHESVQSIHRHSSQSSCSPGFHEAESSTSANEITPRVTSPAKGPIAIMPESSTADENSSGMKDPLQQSRSPEKSATEHVVSRESPCFDSGLNGGDPELRPVAKWTSYITECRLNALASAESRHALSGDVTCASHQAQETAAKSANVGKSACVYADLPPATTAVCPAVPKSHFFFLHC